MIKPFNVTTQIFFLLVVIVLACNQGGDTVSSEDDAERSEFIIKGFENEQAMYAKNCVTCHAPDVGALVNKEWKGGKSWNEVRTAIVKGHASMGVGYITQNVPDTVYDRMTDYILTAIERVTIESFNIDADYSGVVETEEQNFRLDTIARGMVIPWGMAFLPNGDFLITDRNGKFYRQREGEEKVEISGVPEVKYENQGGLLDVNVHPNFAQNQYVYIAYSKPKGEKEATTAVMRAKLQNDALVDKKVIWEALPYWDTPYHYGCRLVFDNDGYLFISMGDRAKRDEMPQSLENFCGKIHRINDDGSIPDDNPFVNTPGAIGSIWSYGHRNPQGLAIDRANNILWESEHAPRGGDEINIIEKGQNYGWPVISYGINYSGTVFTDMTAKEGMVQPEYYYLPSTGTCGLAFVNSDKYPNWKGDLLAGSLRFQYLSRLKLDNNKIVGEERLLTGIGRLRTVNQGPDGYIYIGVEDPGYVFRLMPI